MKTATAVKLHLGSFRGTAHLYRLSHLLKGNRYVILSSLDEALDTRMSETLIFGATAIGKVKTWTDLEGSQRGTTNHKKVLNDLGYTLKGDN